MNLTFLSPAGHCRSRSSTSLQFSLSAIFKKLIHTYIHTYISNDSNIAIKHLRREQRSAIKLKIWKITELLKQSCWGLQFCVENYITMLQISYVGQRMIFTICVGLEGGGAHFDRHEESSTRIDTETDVTFTLYHVHDPGSLLCIKKCSCSSLNNFQCSISKFC